MSKKSELGGVITGLLIVTGIATIAKYLYEHRSSEEIRALGIISILFVFTMVFNIITHKNEPAAPKDTEDGTGCAREGGPVTRWFGKLGCWAEKWIPDLSHEFAGAVVGTLVTFMLVTTPAEQRDNNNRIDQLIWEMGYGDHFAQIHAIDLLREEGALEDGELTGRNFKFANLARANLENAQMPDITFESARLIGVIFDGADLTRADFSGARFYIEPAAASADAYNCPSADSDLAGIRASFTKAELAYATFWNAILSHAYLMDAKLQHADLEGAQLDHADLQRAQLYEANLHNANLQNAILDKANLQGADLQSAALQHAQLEDTQLQGANLQNANLEHTHLAGAQLQTADLQGANLQNANLQGANLQGANLYKAIVQPTQLDHAILDETTIMPNGEPWQEDLDE